MARLIDVPSAVAGVYVGILGYALGAALGVDRSMLLVCCAVGWLLVALVGSRQPRLWVELGRRRLLPLPMLVALLPGVVLTLGLEYEWPVASLPVAGWLLALTLAGMVMWAAGATQYAEQAAGEELVSWTARADPTVRRRRTAGMGLSATACIVAILSSPWYSFSYFASAGTAAYAAGLWRTRKQERTYQACEHGLRYGEAGSTGRQFVPWTRFVGLLETDDAIVLERRWRFDIRLDDDDDVPQTARESLAASIDAPRHGC